MNNYLHNFYLVKRKNFDARVLMLINIILTNFFRARARYVIIDGAQPN